MGSGYIGPTKAKSSANAFAGVRTGGGGNPGYKNSVSHAVDTTRSFVSGNKKKSSGKNKSINNAVNKVSNFTSGGHKKQSSKKQQSILKKHGLDPNLIGREKLGDYISDKDIARLQSKYGSPTNISGGANALVGVRTDSGANVGAGIRSDYLGPNISDTSQRDMASSAFDNLLGFPTANDATTSPSGQVPQRAGQSWSQGLGNAVGRVAQFASDPLGLIPKISSLVGRNLNNPVTDLMNNLGLAGSKGGLVDTGSPYVQDLGKVLGAASQPDNPTGYGENGVTLYNNNKDAGILNSDVATPGTNFSRPGSEQAYNQGTSPIDYGASQRGYANPVPYNPLMPGISTGYSPNLNTQTDALSAISGNNTPVNLGGTNPFAAPLGTGTLDQTNPFPGLTPIEQTPQFTTATDNTPFTPDNGTIQRFLGSGRLSNGLFSNGKGNLNLGGMMGGSNPFVQDQGSVLGASDEATKAYEDWAAMNDKTAQTAQDIVGSIDPQLAATNPEYKGLVNQLSDLISQEANKGLTFAQGSGEPTTIATNSNQDIMDTLNQLGAGGYGSTALSGMGNLMQATSSKKSKKSSDSYSDWEDTSTKSYKDQKKAQEKALQSIIDQINSQYDQSTQEGQTSLDQAKQKDLQGLQQMFNFANSDPNDPQRIQYTQRMNNDYANQYADLVNKIGKSREQDILGAKTNSQQALAQLAANRQATQSQIDQARIQAQQGMKSLAAQQQQQAFKNALKLSQYGQSKNSAKSSQIQDLLARAAQMPSGGREYAQNVANTLGLGNLSGYTPDNWEGAYKTQKSPINLGNGMILDPNTGDVYSTQ